MTLSELLSRFDSQPKQSGGVYKALCPAHADKNPSLSITEKGGKILMNCHGGCSFESVLAALNLKPSDLFTNDNGRGVSALNPSGVHLYVILAPFLDLFIL
jgi:hypothetical protein